MKIKKSAKTVGYIKRHFVRALQYLMNDLSSFFNKAHRKNRMGMNGGERIRNFRKKKTSKITNKSTFFPAPTSWTAQPYSKPAVNRQPGFRREDSSSLRARLNFQRDYLIEVEKKTVFF